MDLDEYIEVERMDILTGCANLLSFLETLSTRLNSNTLCTFSLVLIDLNNFLAYNDEYGHEQGDSVLHWVSIVLRDTGLPVYRIGGDEFLLLIDGKKSEECDQIARSIFERLNRESKAIQITINTAQQKKLPRCQQGSFSLGVWMT